MFLLPVGSGGLFQDLIVNVVLVEGGDFLHLHFDREGFMLKDGVWSRSVLGHSPVGLGSCVHCYILLGPPVQRSGWVPFVLMAFNPVQPDRDRKGLDPAAAVVEEVKVGLCNLNGSWVGEAFGEALTIHPNDSPALCDSICLAEDRESSECANQPPQFAPVSTLG